MLKEIRKKKKLKIKDIALFLGNQSASSVYDIEKNFLNKKTIQYLLFLRKNKININLLLDKINNEID